MHLLAGGAGVARADGAATGLRRKRALGILPHGLRARRRKPDHGRAAALPVWIYWTHRGRHPLNLHDPCPQHLPIGTLTRAHCPAGNPNPSSSGRTQILDKDSHYKVDETNTNHIGPRRAFNNPLLLLRFSEIGN